MTYLPLLKSQARELVREAFRNAALNSASYVGWTSDAIATDMCDCWEPLESFVWLGVASGDREFSDNNFKIVSQTIDEIRKEFGQ